MNPAQLITWLKEPALLDKDSLLPLRSLLDEYPCFTAARMLYLKNLSQLNDVRYSAELVKTAVSVPDRRRLYLFMEDRPEGSLPGFKAEGAGENRDFSLIDRFLHHVSVQEADEDLELADQYLKPGDQPLDQSNDPIDAQPLDQPNASVDAKPLDQLLDQPLSQSMDQPMDVPDTDNVGTSGAFSLDYLHYQALYDEAAPADDVVPAQPMQGQALIDAYLTGDHGRFEAGIPAAAGSTATMTEDDALESMTSGLPEASFSEALARIYVKQKRYTRALEIIKSLSLKYPEKNRYFADQIRYLEQLINSTNQY